MTPSPFSRGARASRRWKRLALAIVGQRVQLECPDPSPRAALIANFGALAASGDDRTADICYTVTSKDGVPPFSLSRDGGPVLVADDVADLLHVLEQDLIVELQKRRTDLLFLHSAAVERQGRAYLLVAESGIGKSTLVWALLQRGFGYLSDELGPVDLASLVVHPYAHALCMKVRPRACPLPAETLDLGRTLHVPPWALPGDVLSAPQPVGGLFFLSRAACDPVVRRIGAAESAMRLYATALNALAHPHRGLDAVIRIGSSVPCFTLGTDNLSAACAAVCTTIDSRTAR